MKTNDLKKGARVKLRNGWFATIEDNKRGNTRMATVEGIYTEMGTVYAHDIIQYLDDEGHMAWVEHTKPQLDLLKQVGGMF